MPEGTTLAGKHQVPPLPFDRLSPCERPCAAEDAGSGAGERVTERTSLTAGTHKAYGWFIRRGFPCSRSMYTSNPPSTASRSNQG